MPKDDNQQPIVLTKKPSLPKKVKDRGARIVIGTLNIFTSPVSKKPEGDYLNYKKKRIFDLTIFLIVLGLIGVSFFFWFVFIPKPLPIKIDITVSPERVKSGQEITYLIKYENVGKDLIQGLNFTFKFPEDFFFRESYPSNFDQRTNTLPIGDLEIGANSQIKIKGIIWGTKDETKKLVIILNSLPQGKKKYARYSVSHSFNIKDTLYKANLKIPEKIFNNSPFEFVLNYSNETNFNLEKIFFNLTIPDHFRLLESEPKPLAGSNQWEIDGVPAKSDGQIKFRGLISYPLNKEQEIGKEFGLISEVQFQDKRIRQVKDQFTTKLLFPKLDLSQEIISPQEAVTLGEEIEYLIKYQNNEDVNVKDVSLRVGLPERFFSLNSVKGENFKITKDKVIFELPGLIEPGESGEMKFKIRTKKVTNYKAEEVNLNLVTSLSASYKLVTNPDQEIISTAKDVSLKVNSEFVLIIEGRYFTPQGDQLGIGPSVIRLFLNYSLKPL